MPLVAGTRLGPYEIVAPLGTGGMGEVYRARDAKLNRDVALKVLLPAVATDPDRLARFTREAQVLASLNHPNIAHIHGIEDLPPDHLRQGFGGQEGGSHIRALVMELVEGPTLAERIARGPIPLDEALPIARQIADALEAAHEQGIIHRDLKPANIKVRPDGTVKVLDFGLAKAVDPTSASDVNVMNSPTLSNHATQAGTLLGTAAYMSPEQAAGKSVDKRSDLWAFGVVLLEMLTGRHVFPGETVSHVLAAVLRAEPDWSRLPADTPPSVRRLLRRCLDKDRKRRLESASDARLEIEEASAGSSDTSAATVAPSARRFSRRELAAWGLAAALALVALMLGIGRLRVTAPDVSLMRFSIEPPEKSTFQSAGRGGWGSPIAVSPDGRHIVFVVVGPDGRQQLWIRALETTPMQPMAGTDGASSPFWSPDSRWVAFFADGKLKRIASGGGEAQVLCDSAPGAGGTWSRDDVILFSPASAGEGGLVRVPAGGGPPVPVTTLDKAHDETNHLWPQFLPDGRHYLFVVGGRDNSGLYVGSLDSTDRTRLLDIVRVGGNASRVVYAAPGYLLFVRGRALLAQPFDAARLALTGDVIQVADGVLKEGPGSAAFSTSANGVLAFWGGAVPQDTRLTWMRRDGSAAGTVGPAGPYFELSLAPNDRTVAVSRFEPNEQHIPSAIWLLDVQRSTATKFTFSVGSMAPTWSRNSAHVAFASPREGPPGLYQKSADNGSQDELMLKSQRTSAPGDWSPDGRTLVYEMLDPATKWDVWALPTSGARTPAPLLRTPFSETGARISPDGRWMAYVSDESGVVEVYVTTFPTPRGKWPVSTGGGRAPEWRRDGKELYYVGAAGTLMAVPLTAGTADAGFEAGTPTMLFELPARPLGTQGIRSNSYAPAADGQRFLVRVPVSETTLAPATVVLNWPIGIRK